MLDIPSQYMHHCVILFCEVNCYCVRARYHCCVLYDTTRDLPLTWYMVHQTEGSVMEITGMLVGLGFIFLRTRRVAGEASRA